MQSGSQTTGATLAAGGAVLAIVSLFLDWYKLDLPGDVPSYTGFEALRRTDVALVLAAVAAIVIAAVLLARLMSESPWPGLALLGVGLAAAAFVLYRGLNAPSRVEPAFGGVVEQNPRIGWYVALVGTVLMAIGGLLAYLAGPRLELPEEEGPGAAP
jgi:hypothetical protein